MDWKQALTEQKLQELAGGRSYTAGLAYFQEDAVSGLLVGENTLSAQVQGSHRYRVRLEFDKQGYLSGDCTCPYADEGHFCKHCVAVGLAWLQADKDPSTRSAPVTVDSLRAYLESRTKEQLVALLLEQVERDSELQKRLLLKVAQSSPNGPNLATYRKSIERAIAIRGYLDYDEVRDYADGVQDVVNSLEELLESGFARETRELAEYALNELNSSLGNIDDSDGNVGEAWQHLNDLHLRATLQAPDDPFALAEWLFKHTMRSDWDSDTDFMDYLPALDEAGAAHFQHLVEDAWEALPYLKPGDTRSYNGNRFRLAQLMLDFAAGDPERLLAIKKRDLSLAYHFLEIAQLYLEMSDADSALEWAEKGKSAFPENTDSRLLTFLVEQYTARERFADAYAILWPQFEKQPRLAAYRALHDYAQARGEWDEWRVLCWQTLRDAVEQRKKQPRGLFYQPADHSELVTILLWEQRDEEAWEEAKAGGCSRDLWLQLAQMREQNHPEDAVRVYQEEIDKELAVISNGDYGDPIRWLLKVRGLRQRLNQEERLHSYVLRLRAEYKRKRNFMKALDQQGFPA